MNNIYREIYLLHIPKKLSSYFYAGDDAFLCVKFAGWSLAQNVVNVLRKRKGSSLYRCSAAQIVNRMQNAIKTIYI